MISVGGVAVKRRGALVGAACLLAVVLGLVYAGWKTWRASEAQICQVCSRPIHSQTRTAGVAGGGREMFCCPACALTAHDQSGNAVRIVELTDYETNSTLDPSQAFLVRGSDVNICARQHGPVDPDKQPTVVHFDRCSPSLLAFARRDAAVRFAREHGGELLRFSALAASHAR